ncbi:MAG: CCA tRNA nucleotidyltransferase [Phycisphaerae bacterium]|jgi:poly(A) polymerase|nr:CCA tRNA nucleotidyltransferase [Phycisphaerae bacterium]HPC22414.1 CCA tRNA nucleotidyltransferase [Phycisphaerae bacterium]HRS28646.1 CCA tRNA nucleotidyltransferase [Phycisphaerae bacterium]
MNNPSTNAVQPSSIELPPEADAAVAIVRKLVDAGHTALLAGGCVRDLLLGHPPQDYDVATSARPEQIVQLFRSTRLVGAQFGVVLVRKRRRWVEVATFRWDGPYLDGRRPSKVVFSDAREDALRRDFTVNGMFFDPLAGQVIDYVGGQPDLKAGVIRAIGEPSARFEEDHLRLLRAVRFAARLNFPIEPRTFAALREHAPQLTKVAAERVRDELERMLSHANRAKAFDLLHQAGLLLFLWPKATWSEQQIAAAKALLARLPAEARFELAFAVLVLDRPVPDIHNIARALTFSNDEREDVAWLVEHQRDLDDPASIPLSKLKRLMAHRAFGDLRQLALARWAGDPAAAAWPDALQARLAAIPPEAVQPPPLVTGDDLTARGIPPGPVYKEVLDALYTRQLDLELLTRDAALAALDDLLRERGLLK